MNANQLKYGIGTNLEYLHFLLLGLLESIPEDDGATWAALTSFRAVMMEAEDQWARVTGEE
ncbi:MAG: hypothetical protein ACLQVJ_07245 [Syntrophobacteraceae bacterium]